MGELQYRVGKMQTLLEETLFKAAWLLYAGKLAQALNEYDRANSILRDAIVPWLREAQPLSEAHEDR